MWIWFPYTFIPIYNSSKLSKCLIKTNKYYPIVTKKKLKPDNIYSIFLLLVNHGILSQKRLNTCCLVLKITNAWYIYKTQFNPQSTLPGILKLRPVQMLVLADCKSAPAIGWYGGGWWRNAVLTFKHDTRIVFVVWFTYIHPTHTYIHSHISIRAELQLSLCFESSFSV